MNINRYSLGVSSFLVSAGLLSAATLISFVLQRGSPLGGLTLIAILIFLSAGLMLRKRHFRWICGSISALMAAGVFFGSVVPSLTSDARTEEVGLFAASVGSMVLMTVVPLCASYFLLLDSRFRQEYLRPRVQSPIFNIAFKVFWIALLVFIMIGIGLDIARLVGAS